MALVDQKNLYLTFKYIAYTKILREYAKLNFSQIGAKRRGEGRGRKGGNIWIGEDAYSLCPRKTVRLENFRTILIVRNDHVTPN